MAGVFAQNETPRTLLLREDFEAYENGEVPKAQPCGVLSEDLVFNASVAQQGLAIEYLKIVTKILDQTNGQ